MASYLPLTDGGLVTWATNFDQVIFADPAAYGLIAPQTDAYRAAKDAYAAAYQTANDPATRSPLNIEAKNQAKAALVSLTRELVKIVQAYPGTTDPMRVELGITVPDTEPTPVAVPETSPIIEVVSVKGNRINLRLRVSADGEPVSGRGKPADVTGATVLSYVGDQPPTEIADWKFEGSTTKTIVALDMPASLAAGSKVWLTAFWFNRKSESGPATTPVSTSVLGGAVG